MIKRLSLLATIGAATAAAFVLAAGSSAYAAPKVTGTVGPGFTITLTSGGKKVTTLKAGRYAFVITDKSSIHNFSLEKGSVHKVLTSVAFVGKKTVTMMLSKGTWRFVCDPHEDGMKGTFKVT